MEAIWGKIYKQRFWIRVLFVGTILFPITVLGVLLYRERSLILSFDWQFQWGFLVLGFGFFLIALLVASLLWADMMRACGSNVTTNRHIQYYCISHVAKRLPGTVWYVAGRGYLYKQHGDSVRLVAITSGIEFIVLFLAGVLVSFVAGYYSLLALSARSVIALLVLALLGMLAIHPNSIRWLMRRMDLEDFPEWKYTDILRWVMGYALVYIIGGLMFFSIGNSIVPIPASNLVFMIGVWSFVGTFSSALFFLPSNLGISEVGISLLLSMIISSSLAVIVAILARVIQIIYELIGLGLVFLFLREKVLNKG